MVFVLGYTVEVLVTAARVTVVRTVLRIVGAGAAIVVRVIPMQEHAELQTAYEEQGLAYAGIDTVVGATARQICFVSKL
jgi:hypothetical protein